MFGEVLSQIVKLRLLIVLEQDWWALNRARRGRVLSDMIWLADVFAILHWACFERIHHLTLIFALLLNEDVLAAREIPLQALVLH